MIVENGGESMRELISGKEHKVKFYDFTRPDKFSMDQIKTMASIHEFVARLAATSFSARLRQKVEVHLASVDQMTYQEYIQELPNPSSYFVVNMDPLKGSILFEISPELTGPMVHRMFGGEEGATKMEREHTNLELGALEELSMGFLGCIREGWSQVIDLRPRMGSIEINPMFVQILPPTEMVVTVTMEIKMGEHQGLLRMGIPYLTIEPIVEKLSAQYWYSTVNRNSKKNPEMESLSRSLPLDLSLVVDGPKLPLKTLLELKEGDAISLDLPLESTPARILSQEKTVLEVELQELLANPIHFSAMAKTPAQNQPKSEFTNAGILEEIRSLREEMRQQLAKPLVPLEAPKEQETNTESFQSPEPKLEISDLSGLELPSDLESLAKVLAVETDQTLAWILAKMEEGAAAKLLGQFDPLRQKSIAYRVATLGFGEERILHGVYNFLQRLFSQYDIKSGAKGSTLQRLVNILQASSRTLEKTVIDGLLESHPDLGKQIIDRMFVFEDLVTLDPQSLNRALQNIELSVLCVAMKSVPDAVRETLLASMPQESRQDLEACLANQGALRISEIEAAQNKVITQIQELEARGEIIIPRFDELVE